MDWFERLTGFRETGYEETRGKLKVDGRQLHSVFNGKSYGIGELELVSLQTLRDRVRATGSQPGRLKVSVVRGDVRGMHQMPANAGALFQVASQFNLLEMMSPRATPEEGVTGYGRDRTQGPACAIAAGAATIYRNYFVPVGSEFGQTKRRQLNGLSDMGQVLGEALGKPVDALWSMENGYALCSRAGLEAISGYLQSLDEEKVEALSGKLRVGVHRDVEVTDADGPDLQFVSQAYCSALPVAYSPVPSIHWESFASLILNAAYEATMWSGVLNAQRGKSNVILLTRLGGGAFGNSDGWIHTAMRRALKMVKSFDLDVKLVSYGPPSHAIAQVVEDFG